MRRLLAPALVFLVLTAGVPARAGEAGATDPDVQSTITSQIDAFNRGDAVAAESFASPGIKAMFPDPGAFLGMVQHSYAALVHPRSTHFDPTVSGESGTVQHVTVVDHDGAVWTAVYTLQKVDGHWTISGCVLLKSEETTA